MAEGTADIMFKPFHMNELRTRLALAQRRRALIHRLHQEKQALHAVSHADDRGLEKEWRRPSAHQRRRAEASGILKA